MTDFPEGYLSIADWVGCGGMFRVPPPTVAATNWLEGLRAYRQFEPYPWHEAKRVDEVA